MNILSKCEFDQIITLVRLFWKKKYRCKLLYCAAWYQQEWLAIYSVKYIFYCEIFFAGILTETNENWNFLFVLYLEIRSKNAIDTWNELSFEQKRLRAWSHWKILLAFTSQQSCLSMYSLWEIKNNELLGSFNSLF